MTTEWRSRINAMVEGLKGDPRISVSKVTFKDAATAAEMASAAAMAGGALPADLIAFYSEMNGFALEWAGPADLAPGASVSGSVDLLPIGEVFGGWKGIVFDDALKPFDHFVTEACAALRLPPGGTASPVYFHIFGEATIDTRHSFVEYLERLLVSRGFWCWIQTLSKQTTENSDAKAFRAIAPQLFPDYQASLFEPR